MGLLVLVTTVLVVMCGIVIALAALYVRERRWLMTTQKAKLRKHPSPSSEKPLVAPNQQAEVQRTIDEHPEIDTMDEEARGEIIDITARRLNPGGGEKPWGRKARTNDPANPNLNTDGMTFLRPDGLFEIYDCISGTDGQATWDGYGPFAQGENGYWWPPNPVEDSGEGEGGGDTDLVSRVAALEQQVDAQATAIETLDARITGLESALAQPHHGHGYINVPVVLESLTSLRARGDIDVAVTPGEATPPPPPSDEGVNVVDVVLLKRLLDRRPDDTPA
jgi:hypothetical protein